MLSVQAADDGKPGDGSDPKDNVNPGNVGRAAAVSVPPANVPKPPCKGAAPSSSIKKTALNVSHKRIRLYGRAVGAKCVKGKSVRTRVRRVQVSVARVSKGKCQFLGPKGKLGKRRRCGRRVYLTAHLTSGVGKQGRTRWSLKRYVKLKSGRYLITSRASGAPGLIERVARSSNSASVTLR